MRRKQVTDLRMVAFNAASSGQLKITEEEKARWAPMLHQCASYILDDVGEEFLPKRGRKRIDCIIEVTLDANRMTSMTTMTPEEEGVLCGLWVSNDRATLSWLRKELNY